MAGKEFPIYCIDSFQRNEKEKLTFDIKSLRKLICEFDITNTPHRHDFFNIIYFKSGAGTHTIDFNTYDVKADSVFFLAPGQVHSWNLSDADGFSLFFTTEFYLMDKIEKSFSKVPLFYSSENSPYLYLSELDALKINEILTSILIEKENSEDRHDTIIRSYLEILMMYLSRYYLSNDTAHVAVVGNHYLRQLEILIEHHFQHQHLPHYYADRLNLSPKHLNEICKKHLGKTVGQLVQKRIALEAKRLLSYSSKNISEVADSLSFDDKSYFIKFFKRQTGITPDKFRLIHSR